MKLIIKQIFFYLMLLGCLNLSAQITECPVFTFANDLTASTSEFKTLIKEPNNFKAWHILNKESPSLRTNIEEIKLVSKSLDEIANAGGYLKWKATTINTFKNVTKLPLNTNDLGKMAMNYRKINNLWHDGNIAVFEYLDNNGNLKTLVQSTIDGNGRHSERLAIEALEKQSVSPKNIKKIYSELEICELESGGLGEGGCKKMVLDKVDQM